MNILFASTEAVPFSKTGGLGDVVGSLPRELNRQGINARVILPFYKGIKDQFGSSISYVKSFTVPLAWRNVYCGLFKTEYKGVIFYFLDNEQYFDRDRNYGYYDDGERFAFYSMGVLAAIKESDFEPDILHCNEWQTAMVPVYRKTLFGNDPYYDRIPVVFTIHNIEYQGRFGKEILADLLGLTKSHESLLEMNGDLNFMKGAIVTCDHLTTVSPTYAEEILYPFYAHGMEKILGENRYKLTGILNGIDRRHYNPSWDRNLAFKYSVNSVDKKILNKRALQQELGLIEDADTPIVAMVGRMAEHKGIELVIRAFDDMMKEPMQFVMLGTGEAVYEEFFHRKREEYHGRMSVNTAFSTKMASRIYAGSDLFLMPSISEPCGLAQMIALRYGTVPIVRETGGLKDTVKAFNKETGKGNGITFSSINAHDMLYAVRRGQAFFNDESDWRILVKNAFMSNYSWKNSAIKYIKIYDELLEGRY